MSSALARVARLRAGRRQRWSRFAAACLLFAYTTACPLTGRAARRTMTIEPQPLRLRISDAALQLWIESLRETTRFAGSDDEFRREVLGISPTASFSLDGSVYHPNFLRFAFRPEVGYAWYDKYDDAFDPSSGTETGEILNYSSTITLLGAKPYALTIASDRQRTVRHDDFFTRQEVLSTHHSAQSGYTTGPVPLTLTAARRETVVEDFRRYETREQTFGAEAHNNRGEFNSTLFTYHFEDFEYLEEALTDDGIRHTASLTDREVFDPAQKRALTSDLRFDDTTRNEVHTTALALRENFRVKHREKLSSEYDYLFNDNQSDDADSRSHELSAGLQHQLFESLYSSVNLDGSYGEDGGPGFSSQRTRLGGGFNERYTKRLPNEGRLGIDFGARYVQQDNTSSGGSATVVDEVHRLSDGEVTLLNRPDVDRDSVVVTDVRGLREYREGLDYLLFSRGRSTQIERVPGGQIPDGSSVRVTYRAGQSGSGSIETWQDNYGFRLDLWDRLLGLYARRYEVDSSGDFDQSLQNADETVIGVDTTYRALRAGLEYEDYQSNFSSFTAWRAFQSLQWRPGDMSTLGLDGRQQRSHFPDDGDDQDMFSLVARYEVRLSKHLSCRTEAGAQFERGIGPDDLDRNLYSARASADYWVGRVVVRAAYEYQNSDYDSDTTERHLASLRLQRKF